jgi:hypothetical protein
MIKSVLGGNMSETEKLQNLHQRSVKGEVLSEQEQNALQNWYDKLDREEDLIINKKYKNEIYQNEN